MGRTERGKPLGPLESTVMAALWDAAEALPVRAVLDTLNRDRDTPLAYTTVMTVLTRLDERGVVAREKIGRGYVYRPVAATEADVAVRRLLNDYGDAALASFVDRVDADEQLRARLRRLVGDEP